MTIVLSITPISIEAIPPAEGILDAAKRTMEESKGWPKGKRYSRNTVQTFVLQEATPDASWCGRHSVHNPLDGTWDDFYQNVIVNKLSNEQQYVPELAKVKLLKQLSPQQEIWTAYYKFPPPVSPRLFTVLITTFVEELPEKTAWVVSIPVDVSSDGELAAMEEHSAVRGRYVAVEKITQEMNDTVSWRMITSSTPGGLIPRWLADQTVPSTIAQDVPHFLKWFKKKKGGTST